MPTFKGNHNLYHLVHVSPILRTHQTTVSRQENDGFIFLLQLKPPQQGVEMLHIQCQELQFQMKQFDDFSHKTHNTKKVFNLSCKSPQLFFISHWNAIRIKKHFENGTAVVLVSHFSIFCRLRCEQF